MLNVLLIEENINYGTKLINLLASTSKLFRLAGIVNNLKDLKYILNYQKVELILFDMKVLDFENKEEKLKRYFGKKNFSKPSPRKVIFTVLNKIKNK